MVLNNDISNIFSLAKDNEQNLKNIPLKKRLHFISLLRKKIILLQDEIINHIIHDTKKPKFEALTTEIFPVLAHLSYLESNSNRYLKRRKVKTPAFLAGKSSWIYFEPIGTVLILSPWNYPFYQAIIPITTAFVAGCPVVFKPSEYAPLKGLFEKLFSSFDKNWIQIIYGDGQIGQQLIDHKPSKIFFTGSVQTGKKIMAQASKYLIPVDLELGGKDCMLVFKDSNLKKAVNAAIWGSLTNCGQVCTSIERIYIEKDIYDKFKSMLLASIKNNFSTHNENNFSSPTTSFQYKKIVDQIEDARSLGALIYETYKTQETIGPVLIENPPSNAKVLKEETFGPLIVIKSFKNFDEAIKLANTCPFSLSANIWTKNNQKALSAAKAVKAGSVSINNVMLVHANPYLPFGGIKDSGFGRFKGEFGFYAFSNIKSIIKDNINTSSEPYWYPYTEKIFYIFKQMTSSLFGSKIKIKFLYYGIKSLFK